MAASSFKNPPIFGPGISYETWKNELEIWRRMTDLDKKKQALAVTLTLQGQARAKAVEIDVDKLGVDGGMDTLISELDKIFLRDAVDVAYEHYTKFDKYVRGEGQDISEFIIEFERRYEMCKKSDMPLPDSILSFKLLESAGLSETNRHLALTAARDLNFATMKSALKRIFGGSANNDSNGDPASGITVKQEAALYTRNNPNQRGRYPPQKKFSRYGNDKGPSSDKMNTPRGTNPLDRYGYRTKCVICKSVFHWAKDCPHREEANTVSETEATATPKRESCNITLFTNANGLDPNQVFMSEAFNTAVVDTACTRTVCGKAWLENYCSLLDDSQKNMISSRPSDRSFRFGDGKQVGSTQEVTIPATIGNTDCCIQTEVVDIDLPLLLSKSTLKKAGTVLDMNNDTAKIFDQTVNLQQTSTGHYCIDLLKQKTKSKFIENQVLLNSSEETVPFHQELVSEEVALRSEALQVIEVADKEKQKKELVKLHKQFGHASAERIGKLLNSAGVQDATLQETLKAIVNNCETCQLYRKTPPRPAAGLPLATDFNQTVAVDLHELAKNIWYLHIIDEFTRFSSAGIVRRKLPSVFIQEFITHWISIFGCPKSLFSDNGGEFSNDETRDMCENMNIDVKTTAAYAPWSNGLLEKHNHILTDMVLKIKHDKACSWETALKWALNAKNSMINVHGFSSYQLVFGRNPNLPTNLDNKLPALEGITTSQTVGEHLGALYAARRAFTEAECSERVRRALKKQVRTYTGDHYEMGEKVFYKRPDSQQWKGPGRVIGQDGKIVFIRHGGILVRVHISRLQKYSQNDATPEPEVHAHDDTHSQENNTEEPAENSEDEEKTEVDQNDEPEIDAPVQENVHHHDMHEREAIEHARLPRAQIQPHEIKPGQFISFKNENQEEKLTAQITSRAGKAKGKHKAWYNLRYLDSNKDPESVNLERVQELAIVQNPQPRNESSEPSDTENEVMVSESAVSFEKAKEKELESWREHQVYEEVPDNGQKTISTRWICTLKDTEEGIVPKARLVARGFEEWEDVQSDSPTCGAESLRILLTILAQKDWTINSIDIKTAFLQGNKLERAIYIKPPVEANTPAKIWFLKKCVYGLCDASLYWYNKVKEVMLKTSGKLSKVDPAVFSWHDPEGNLIGILACHVDDFIWGGTKEFEETVITQVRQSFTVGREHQNSFKYLGLQMVHEGGTIVVHQSNFAKGLSPIAVNKGRAMQKSQEVTEEERSELRSKVGQLLWIGRQTRPDVLYDTTALASHVKRATVADLLEANKIIKRVKSENVALRFQNVGEKRLSLLVYSDASLGNTDGDGSQGGQLVLLVGDEKKCCPIGWYSRRIRRVVRSTLAAETLAMADGIDQGIFLLTLYCELYYGKADPTRIPLKCITDCKSLHDAVMSTKLVSEKRLRLELSVIKENLEKEQVKEIKWVEAGEQLADCLTKKGTSAYRLLNVLEQGRI